MQNKHIVPFGWADTQIIYYDPKENYSLVWGKYENFECLGLCWNSPKSNYLENNYSDLVKIPHI